MTKDQYWEALCAKRPILRDPAKTIEFTPENLKKTLFQLYDIAYKAGTKMGDDLKNLDEQFRKGKSGFDETMKMFEDIMGRKFR
jgi:conjugal transfer/entry exclusion protein